MARENQGLHAALIVFVVLTIFLAVSTFVFFSQAKDAKEQAAKYGKDAQTNQALATDKDKLMKEFMGMMGFAEGDSPETVRDKFAEDMQKFAPKDVDEQARVYREVLRRQDELIKLGNQSYAVEQAKTKKYEEDLVAVNQLADAKIAEFEKQAAEATKDKDRETLQFQQDRDRIEKAQEQLAGDLDQTRKDHQQELGLKDTDIAKLKQDVVALADVYAKAKGMVDDMRQEVPDQFQAQVRLVNQRGGIVWLDRGSDDGLRPQTKFSVFPSGSSNVSEVGKKANIEVTRVLNGHLAEARIVDDDPLNPI
ncbi:MAG TPA: hypothetical protein VJL29_04410, partial [Thermoguttaceae bacterium]|nr:hypothetical protein [Thermoguttaceae bacterium]